MKKRLLAVALTGLFSTSAFAAHDIGNDGTELKLNGVFDFQFGYINQNHRDKSLGERKVSQNHDNFALFTSAALSFDIAKHQDDLIYGGRITTVLTTNLKGSPGFNGSRVFVTSDFGKVELGTMQDAGAEMRLSGFDVAVAAADGWGRYVNKDISYFKNNGVSPSFSYSAEYFFDDIFGAKNSVIIDGTELSRKVNYFTPKFKGFQFGVSYIPDSQNVGIGSLKANETGIDVVTLTTALNDTYGDLEDTKTITINRNVKDAVSLGVTYERNLADGVDLKLSAGGEYGKAVGNIVMKTAQTDANDPTTAEVKKTLKLKNLNTYNFGAVLKYGNFSYGASYGSLNKSLTNSEYHKTGRNVNYFNAAVAYKFGDMTTSLAYFKSGQYKNTTDAVSLGAEYNMAPGLVPYAQLTYFQLKGRPEFYPDVQKKKTRGTVALLGAKLKL